MSAPDEHDERFVNLLFASARKDAQPDGIEDAWVRFGSAFGAVHLAAGSRGTADAPAARQTPVLAQMTHGPGRTLAAAKWCLFGVVVGAGVTGAVTLRQPIWRSDSGLAARRAPDRAPPPVSATTQPALAASDARRVSASSTTAPSQQGTVASRPARTRAAAESRRDDGRSPPLASKLAEEVARIDTARTVSAMGDQDEAIALIDRYHRDCPTGALAPDADVVALEAAAAKRDIAEISRRAAQFLTRYPDDPHAARVRWLARHPSPAAR